MHYAARKKPDSKGWKKPDSKGYVVYDSICYMTFWKSISSFPGLRWQASHPKR